MSKNKTFHDFKVRHPQKDWDLFMQHCREESLKCGKTISATVEVDYPWLKDKQNTLF